MIKTSLSQATMERRSVSSELDSMKDSLKNLGLQYSAVEKVFQKQSEKQSQLEHHIVIFRSFTIRRIDQHPLLITVFVGIT